MGDLKMSETAWAHKVLSDADEDTECIRALRALLGRAEYLEAVQRREYEAPQRVIYRLADGGLIWGEYDYVSDTEYFEDVDRPVDVIVEWWTLRSATTVTFKPRHWDDT